MKSVKAARDKILHDLGAVSVAMKNEPQSLLAADFTEFPVPREHVLPQVARMDQQARIVGAIVVADDSSNAWVLDQTEQRCVL
jgi:hypothetical protein